MLLAVAALAAFPASAQTIRIEAENAAFSDFSATDTEPGAEARDASRLGESGLSGPVSGTGFAALQKGVITFDISAVPDGQYTLTLAYASPETSVRYENITVDGRGYGKSSDCTTASGVPGLQIDPATMFTPLVVSNASGTEVTVDGTTGTVVISACYGYSYFDYLEFTVAATPPPTAPPTASFTLEAEDAAFSDAFATDTEPGAEARDASRLGESGLSGPVSGTGFAALQKGVVTFDISAVPNGQYTLTLAYASPDPGERFDALTVDGRRYGKGTTQCLGDDGGPSVVFTQHTMFTPLVVARTGEQAVTVDGTTGTIAITACYGYSYFDYIRLDPVVATATQGAPDLSAELRQNAPNPFAGATVIPYSLAESAHVRLSVYDLTGRRVASLVDEVQGIGDHSARFDATGLSSGVYVYRLETGSGVQLRRMIQVR